MTPGDLAALHARAFADQRPWTEAEFASLLGSPHVVLLSVPMGFLLGRVLADEAEILTLAVDPDAQRQGHARWLLHGFLAQASAHAVTAFLDVAEDNTPARSLYAAAGFIETGRRRGYFTRPDGPPVDAILMTRALTDS